MIKESYKIKKFDEFKNLNECLRYNTKFLSLNPGKHSIKDVLDEVIKLKENLEMWSDGVWITVTTVDIEHKEIIPLTK